MKNESIEEKILFDYLLRNSKNELSNSSSNFMESDINLEMPDNKLAQMELFWNEMDCIKMNPSYRVLPTSKNIIQRLNVFVKKVIRRLLRWYIDPICEQQTSFNGSITRLSGAQIEVINYFQAQLVDMRNKLNISESRNSELQNQLNDSIKTTEELFSQKFDSSIKTVEQMFYQKIGYMERIVEETNFACKSNTEKIIELEKNKKELPNTWNEISELDNLFYQQFISTAQAGEDRILATLLFSVGISYNECSYIDIGANHPIVLSNTYYFYKLGAQGVLIEANPSLISELERKRPRDTILNLCVSNEKEDVEFYIMNKDGLSTASKESMENLTKENPEICVKEKITIKTISANEIIEQYLKVTPTIINIDIEGMELNILQQLDFDKYRPFIIIVENIEVKKELIYNDKSKALDEFMRSKEYREYAFTGINSIFIDSRRR